MSVWCSQTLRVGGVPWHRVRQVLYTRTSKQNLKIGSQFLNVSPKTAPSLPFTLSKTGGTLVIVSVNAGDCTGHGHHVSRYHAAFRVDTVDPSEARRSCRKYRDVVGWRLSRVLAAIGSKRGSG